MGLEFTCMTHSKDHWPVGSGCAFAASLGFKQQGRNSHKQFHAMACACYSNLWFTSVVLKLGNLLFSMVGPMCGQEELVLSALEDKT